MRTPAGTEGPRKEGEKHTAMRLGCTPQRDSPNGYFHYRAKRGFLGCLPVADGVGDERLFATLEELENVSLALIRLKRVLRELEEEGEEEAAPGRRPQAGIAVSRRQPQGPE